MARQTMLAVALVLLGGAAAGAVELVAVPGSGTRFTTTMEAAAGEKPVKLVLTGVAVRQKLFLNVYAIASYLQEGVRVRTAEELAAADGLKRLHLVMERDVDGKDLAQALQAGIRLNYPEPTFGPEVHTLVQTLQGDKVKKGDHIFLTHVPGVGLHCSVAGKGGVWIQNPQFSRAVWDIYLGRNHLGDAIKKGLVSRL
jgi:hypothetical protein